MWLYKSTDPVQQAVIDKLNKLEVEVVSLTREIRYHGQKLNTEVLGVIEEFKKLGIRIDHRSHDSFYLYGKLNNDEFEGYSRCSFDQLCNLLLRSKAEKFDACQKKRKCK